MFETSLQSTPWPDPFQAFPMSDSVISTTIRPADRLDIPNLGVRGTARWQANWSLIAATVLDVRDRQYVEIDYTSPYCRLVINRELCAGRLEVKTPGQQRSGIPPKGPLTFIPPNTEVIFEIEQLRYMRQIVLQFDASDLKQSHTEGGKGLLDTANILFRDEHMSRLIDILMHECLQPHSMSPQFIDSLALAVFNGLSRTVTNLLSARGLAPWQLRRVMEYMQSRLPEAMPLETLARETSLSRSYFCRGFKLSTGYTPHQWQLRARIELTKKLMLETDIPLAQIALEAGFSDQAHFTRVFSSVAGVSPAKWAKAART